MTLTGSIRDALGRSHQVKESIDVSLSAAVLRETRHRYEQPTDERLVKELEKTGVHLDSLVKAVRTLAGGKG